jgi:hypothetical protein
MYLLLFVHSTPICPALITVLLCVEALFFLLFLFLLRIRIRLLILILILTSSQCDRARPSCLACVKRQTVCRYSDIANYLVAK